MTTLNPVAVLPDVVRCAVQPMVNCATPVTCAAAAAATDEHVAVPTPQLIQPPVAEEEPTHKKPTVLGRGRSALPMCRFEPEKPSPPSPPRPPKDVGGVGCRWWSSYAPLMIVLVIIIVPCVLLLPNPNTLPPTPRASMQLVARFEGVSPLALSNSGILQAVLSSLSYAVAEVTDLQPIQLDALFVANSGCMPVWGVDVTNMTGRALRAAQSDPFVQARARALATAPCIPSVEPLTSHVGFTMVLGSTGSVDLLRDLLTDNGGQYAGDVVRAFSPVWHVALDSMNHQQAMAGSSGTVPTLSANATMAALVPIEPTCAS